MRRTTLRFPCMDIPEGGLFRRWLAFNAVGGAGILVQLAVLTFLTEFLRWNYLAATVAAVEAAVLHNFLWHEHWTWADRVVGRGKSAAGRLLRFHLSNGAVSIAGNVVLMRLFVRTLGIPLIFANLAAIAICSVLNFFAAEYLVFNRRPLQETPS